ncbi:hypothetical protein [Fusibacter bizertensis]
MLAYAIFLKQNSIISELETEIRNFICDPDKKLGEVVTTENSRIINCDLFELTITNAIIMFILKDLAKTTGYNEILEYVFNLVKEKELIRNHLTIYNIKNNLQEFENVIKNLEINVSDNSQNTEKITITKDLNDDYKVTYEVELNTNSIFMTLANINCNKEPLYLIYEILKIVLGTKT